MLLSDREIRIAIQSGDLLIDPPPPDDSERWQPASVDLRLHPTIWVQKEGLTTPISNIEDLDIEQYLKQYTTQARLDVTNGFTFLPGMLVIGQTLEWIGLSNLLSGRVEGRSRLARMGIGVHITAPKIDPGFENYITLEMFHIGKTPVVIPNEMQICTLMVERLGYPAGQGYQGIFQGQPEAQG
jgi:dCTP deaminase